MVMDSRTNDEEKLARGAVVWNEACERLVREEAAIARRHLPFDVSVDDLRQTARIAAWKAAKEFKDGVGHIGPYMRMRVRWAIVDELRRERITPGQIKNKVSRVPFPKEKRLPRMQSVERDWLLCERLTALLREMPIRDARILVLMFVHDLSGAQIARRLRLSEGRINQIKRRALTRLRKALKHS